MLRTASSLYWEIICDMSPESAVTFAHPAYNEIPNDALIRGFMQDGEPLVSGQPPEIRFMMLCFIHEYLKGEGL